MKPTHSTLLLISILLLPVHASACAVTSEQTTDSRAAFFDYIKGICGQSFEGSTDFPSDPEHALVGKRLVMTVASCSDDEIRIPFRVGDDTSRTWILTLTEKGLLFKHDHRHADGTPDEITMYGGWATTDGTGYRQRFPADPDTAKLIPEAATNVWTLEVDKEKQQFIYYLERHGEPRYRAVFSLKPISR